MLVYDSKARKTRSTIRSIQPEVSSSRREENGKADASDCIDDQPHNRLWRPPPLSRKTRARDLPRERILQKPRISASSVLNSHLQGPSFTLRLHSQILPYRLLIADR